MPDGMVFLPSFYESIKELPDDDRLIMYDAIVKYGLLGESTPLTGIHKSLFTLIVPVIDASKRRYGACRENGGKPPKEGSKPRGRPRKNQQGKQTENQSGKQDKDIETDYDCESEMDLEEDSDSECDADNAASRFAAPTLEDVNAFAYEIGARSNPEMFFNYYQARGWKTGKDIITDWKALFKTWEAREAERDNDTNNIFLKMKEAEERPKYEIIYDN